MAHESSMSRGKGSRRMPGRSGGAGKRRKSSWESQAVHMVKAANELPDPVVSIAFHKPWSKNSSESIYLFDQEAAKAGIVYFAEEGTGPWHSSSFFIHVNDQDKVAVERIVERLNPPRRPLRNLRFSGWWTEIQPTRLTKAHGDHPWVFARYSESNHQRDDGLEYTAFLFRDRDRTIFGIKEWLGKNLVVRHDDLQKMAHRVVNDRDFRKSLVSDDADLPRLWKKH